MRRKQKYPRWMYHKDLPEILIDDEAGEAKARANGFGAWAEIFGEQERIEIPESSDQDSDDEDESEGEGEDQGEDQDPPADESGEEDETDDTTAPPTDFSSMTKADMITVIVSRKLDQRSKSVLDKLTKPELLAILEGK